MFGAFLIFGLIVVGYIFCHCYQKLRQAVCGGEKKPKQEQAPPPELPPFPFSRMTANQLLDYDGTRRDGRILIAFKGKIYDVSTGLEEFSPQGVLGCVAGKNFSEYLERTLQPRETIVDYITRWDSLLDKNYPLVGILVEEEDVQEKVVKSEQDVMQQHLEDVDKGANDNNNNDNDDDDDDNVNDNDIIGNGNDHGHMDDTFLDSSDVQLIESTFEDDDASNSVIDIKVGKMQVEDVPAEAKIRDTPETPLNAAISEKSC